MNAEQKKAWMYKHQKSIARAINDVAEIVSIENLKPRYDPAFYIEFHISMAGKCLLLRVYKSDNFECIEKMECWQMDLLFKEIPFKSEAFDLEKINRNVTGFIYEIEKMKRCAMRYIGLNEAK